MSWITSYISKIQYYTKRNNYCYTIIIYVIIQRIELNLIEMCVCVCVYISLFFNRNKSKGYDKSCKKDTNKIPFPFFYHV